MSSSDLGTPSVDAGIDVGMPLPGATISSTVAPAARRFFAMDMGGTNLRGAVVDHEGAILELVSEPLPPDLHDRLAAPIRLAARFSGQVEGIGLAIAGTVIGGRLTWSANLGLHDVDYQDLLEAETGLPAVVLNDARAAGLAEARVADSSRGGVVLLVTVGTGIGGALVVDGNLLQGTGEAGEIGHMVIDPAGPSCACGRRGCWEVLAGGRALRAAALALYDHNGHRQGMPELRDPVMRLTDDARAGLAAADSIIDRAAALFALGLDNVCAVLAPHVVVLGGGVMARDGLVAHRYQAASQTLRWGSRSRIVRASLGDRAGLLGAALASTRNTR